MEDVSVLPDLNAWRSRTAVVVAVVVVIAAIVWMSLAGSEGPQLGLIPTLIALTAKKFFGKKKGDAERALGDHPAVAFIFQALTTGEMDGAEDIVADEFHAYANGYVVVDSAEGDGAEKFRDNIEYWRAAAPDIGIDIYDEVSAKLPDKTDSIAVRYVVHGTLQSEDGGLPFEVEAAAFVKVVDHKLTEWRVVVDESFFVEMRAAMGLPTAG